MARLQDIDIPHLEFAEAAAPATPATSIVRIYAKTDGLLYSKDDAGAETLVSGGAAGAAAVGNMWSINKSSSQTLTSATDTLITFDTTLIDGGGSVIDLANEQFVAPATGFYMAFATWVWEATAPGGAAAAAMACYVNGSDTKASRCRLEAATFGINGGANGAWALSLSAGDTVKLYINPGGATPTARGNAAAQIATSFTLVRIT